MGEGTLKQVLTLHGDVDGGALRDVHENHVVLPLVQVLCVP